MFLGTQHEDINPTTLLRSTFTKKLTRIGGHSIGPAHLELFCKLTFHVHEEFITVKQHQIGTLWIPITEKKKERKKGWMWQKL